MKLIRRVEEGELQDALINWSWQTKRVVFRLGDFGLYVRYSTKASNFTVVAGRI